MALSQQAPLVEIGIVAHFMGLAPVTVSKLIECGELHCARRGPQHKRFPQVAPVLALRDERARRPRGRGTPTLGQSLAKLAAPSSELAAIATELARASATTPPQERAGDVGDEIGVRRDGD